MTGHNLAASKRLAALDAVQLMDTPPEPEFDAITRLVRRTLGVDVSLISLVDDRRQFFKSHCGLAGEFAAARQTPLSHSFCQHVVVMGDVLEVADAKEHPELRDNLAIRDLNVTAYLGMPLRSADGEVLGSLCAIHGTSRDWSDGDRATLADFAALVERTIAMRSAAMDAIHLAELKDTLAREYNHRVKNTFALAVSLVRLSEKGAASANDLSTALQNRMMALASAHDALAESSEQDGIELGALIARLLRPYAGVDAGIEWNGPVIALAAEQVTPLCLLFHELATNSAKYGALKSGRRVDIDWSCEDNRVTLRWVEPTRPNASGNNDAASGFGNQLLRLSARLLDGEIDQQWTDDKLTVEMGFTMPDWSAATATVV